MVEAIYYLDGVVVPDRAGSLATERQLLPQRLQSRELLVSPDQWPGLLETAHIFRRRFASAYIRHHDAYHSRMGILGQRMADIRLEAQALERLNTIPELGNAKAPELAGLVEELYNSIIACPVTLESERIERFPRCTQCSLRFDSEPPNHEVEELGSYVTSALGEQCRRLSRRVVDRLLHSERTDRLQRFIDVLQVSDVQGLAQVMDDNLVQFTRELLVE